MVKDIEGDLLMREVEDDVRREKLQKFWKDFGSYMVSASLLILVATIAVVSWQSYKHGKQEELTSHFLAADRAFGGGKGAEAEKELQQVIDAGDATLSPLARLRLAEIYLMEKKTDLAKQVIEPLATDDKTMGIYAYFIRMLTADVDQLKALDVEQNPFRATVRDMLAMRYIERNDRANAAAVLKTLSADAETPASIKERATLLSTTLFGAEEK